MSSVSCVNPAHRNAFTSIMFSSHALAVERLRWGERYRSPVPRGWRLCRFCREHVEDEVHALLECRGDHLHQLEPLREVMRMEVTTIVPDFNRHSDSRTVLLLLHDERLPIPIHPTPYLSCLCRHNVIVLLGGRVFVSNLMLSLVRWLNLKVVFFCSCCAGEKLSSLGQLSLEGFFTASENKGSRSTHVFYLYMLMCVVRTPALFLMGPRWLIYPILSYSRAHLYSQESRNPIALGIQ